MKTAAVTIPVVTQNFEAFSYKARQKSLLLYKKCEKAWGYIGKSSRVVHLSLNASLKSCFTFTLGCKGVDNQVMRAIARLKVFSALGLPFGVQTTVSTAQAVIKNIRQKDAQGIALGTLSFVIVAGDLLDSIATVVNAVLTLASKNVVTFFSNISLPLSFGLVSLGALSRSIQLIKTSYVFAKFSNSVKSQPDSEIVRKSVYDFLHKYLGDTLQKRDLERSCPPEVIEKFENIYRQLKEEQPLSPENAKKLVDDIGHIFKSLKKKMSIDIASLFASAVTATGLTLISRAVILPIGIALVALAITMRIGILAYQDLTKPMRL